MKLVDSYIYMFISYSHGILLYYDKTLLWIHTIIIIIIKDIIKY